MSYEPQFFKRSDLDAFDGTPVPPSLEANRDRVLALLDIIRRHAGRPIVVTPRGGYRPEALNRAIGGKPKSRHMKLLAADIRFTVTQPGETRETLADMLHDFILGLHSRGVLPCLGGLGKYPSFCHVDVDVPPSGKLRRWGDTRADD